MPTEKIFKNPVVKAAGFVLVFLASAIFLLQPVSAWNCTSYQACVADCSAIAWSGQSTLQICLNQCQSCSVTPTPTPDLRHCVGSDVCGSPGTVVLDPSGVMQWNPSLKSTDSWCYRLTSAGTWTVGGSAFDVSYCGDVTPTPTITLYPTPTGFPTVAPTAVPSPYVTAAPIDTIGTLSPTWAPVINTDDYKNQLRNSTVGNITAPFLNFADSVGVGIQNFGMSVLSFLLVPFTWLTSYMDTVLTYLSDAAVSLATMAKYVLLMIATTVNVIPVPYQMLITLVLCLDVCYVVLKGRAGNG